MWLLLGLLLLFGKWNSRSQKWWHNCQPFFHEQSQFVVLFVNSCDWLSVHSQRRASPHPPPPPALHEGRVQSAIFPWSLSNDVLECAVLEWCVSLGTEICQISCSLRCSAQLVWCLFQSLVCDVCFSHWSVMSVSVTGLWCLFQSLVCDVCFSHWSHMWRLCTLAYSEFCLIFFFGNGVGSFFRFSWICVYVIHGVICHLIYRLANAL